MPEAVKQAVQIGYRHIDTAQAYGNEAGVGCGINECGVSNFLIDDLQNILDCCTIKPMVNQILTHISNTPLKLISFCKENDSDQLLKGASESGNEVEKINLSGLTISPCVACYGTGTWDKGDVYDIYPLKKPMK